MKMIRRLAVALILLASALQGIAPAAFAYEHHDSPVNFVEYAVDAPLPSARAGKPYFLLFSAQWCHWCHEFAGNTLTRADVAAYLNRHFINVFIDVDVHNAAYAKYRATGLPYTVFLNPDGSLYYKYAGTLYGDAFLDVIKQVAAQAGAGNQAIGMAPGQIHYTPPANLNLPAVKALPGVFMRGVLDNFDPREHGLGKGQKSIQPRTFLYVLENAPAGEREQAARRIAQTLERAVERIYDPVEGGFFRYAETRRWEIPHYEKFSDLNAGIVLALYELHRRAPAPRLKQAADATLAYLTSTLFRDDPGAFLSFQVADTGYYRLNRQQRKTAAKPKVTDKVFTDRLAATLGHLIRVIEYADDRELEGKVRQSLEFLAGMIMRDGGMRRYYALADRQWRGRGGLADHAHVARLFTDAAARFEDARYSAVAAKVVRAAIAEFYDGERKLFTDAGAGNAVPPEYLLELNGLLACALLELNDQPPGADASGTPGAELIEPLIAHYSSITEVLEERIWDGAEWDLTEAYVPYLDALEKYFSTHSAASAADADSAGG